MAINGMRSLFVGVRTGWPEDEFKFKLYLFVEFSSRAEKFLTNSQTTLEFDDTVILL